MNLRLILFAMVGFVGITEGVFYVSALNARTKALEARLAQLEVEVKGIQPTVMTVNTSALSSAPSTVQCYSRSQPFVYTRSSLEARVTEIEQEMTPHIEPIQMARPR